jgi:hypothetical protein
MFGVLFASIEQRLELRPANCARLAGTDASGLRLPFAKLTGFAKRSFDPAWQETGHKQSAASEFLLE